LFEILERIGIVTYMISLLVSMCIHNVFHVSFLKKCVLDDNHVIDWNVIQVEQEGDCQVYSVCILDQKVKLVQNQAIGLVKFEWTWYGPEDPNWDNEDEMWA
jgi:hypothetical protein